MTRLFYFTITQEKRRDWVFLCAGMEEMGVYIIVVEKIWIECHLMGVHKG